MVFPRFSAPTFLSGRALFNGFADHLIEIAIADDRIGVYVIAQGHDPYYPLCFIYSHAPGRSITLKQRPAIAFESNVLPLPDHAYAAVVAFLKAHRAYAMTVGAAA